MTGARLEGASSLMLAELALQTVERHIARELDPRRLAVFESMSSERRTLSRLVAQLHRELGSYAIPAEDALERYTMLMMRPLPDPEARRALLSALADFDVVLRYGVGQVPIWGSPVPSPSACSEGSKQAAVDGVDALAEG